MSSATRETYGYLPSRRTALPYLRLVPDYATWWQRHIVREQLAHRSLYLAVERPGIEHATT